MRFTADTPNSARIAAVCQQELANLATSLSECTSSIERSKLLRDKLDTERLLDFALNQKDYQTWFMAQETVSP